MEFKVEGREATEKIVKEGGSSGRIYLPKKWIGRKVVIILLEGKE